MKKRTEMSEKWEFKAGDQQQQISEMERIRKALTVQIHGLRQEIGPKESKLLLITEKLQEMDQEYDLALQALSGKELVLSQKSASLYMLQKQVRDLRSYSGGKDACLRRAAVLFDQYRQTIGEATLSSLDKGQSSTKTLSLSQSARTLPPGIANTTRVALGKVYILYYIYRYYI